MDVLIVNRRRFLLGTTALVGVTAAGCAGNSPAAVTAALVAFAKSASAEFAGVQPLLTQAGVKVPADIGNYIQDAITALNALNDASTETQGASVLNQVIGDINAVAPVLIPVITTINPGIGAGIGLVVAALPFAESLFSAGVAAFTAISTPATQLVSKAPAPAVSARLGAPLAPPSSQDYFNLLLHRHGMAGYGEQRRAFVPL